MRYYGEEALGMVETLGMVPALEACDKMLKAADVELVSYENVGSTLVTIMVMLLHAGRPLTQEKEPRNR